jgi:hypothetical protein
MLTAAVATVALGRTAQAVELWVDPQGLGGVCNDAGTGASSETPLCTLAECLARATAAGDRCVLRAGRYVGSAVPAADGRSGAPITVASHGGETVEVWGTVPLDGAWRSESDDVFSMPTSLPRPLALLETVPGAVEATYGPWSAGGRRPSRPDRMAPGSFAWEAGDPLSTLKIRRGAGHGDANASAWRARVAELDLRDRRSLTFDGIVFVDMRVHLEGATDVQFEECRFVRAGSEPAAPQGTSTLGPSAPPAPLGDRRAAPEIEIGPESASGTGPPDVLRVDQGGTGADSAEGARARLGAAWDANVVHLTMGEVIRGPKTFEAPVVIRELNGVKRSTGFGDISECVASLPAGGGVCMIDPTEDDETPFNDVNPDVRAFSLVRDSRRGGARWLSSRPEPGSGATEDQVPFVFQVRWNDPSRTYDDEPGAVGEWNCGVDVPDVIDEWRNCPNGFVTKGSASPVQPYWYTGQCNSNSSSPSSRCGGPHILEVRSPELPGVVSSKPIFAVGTEGASIYMPDYHDIYFQSALTIFRGRSSYFSQEMWNIPMYAFDKGGFFSDGGSFVGNTLAWPEPYSSHLYQPYNMWVQHDIALDLPAFVVEGAGDGSPEGERSPIAKLYDRSGKGSWNHPGLAREAFGFYSDSRLYLGSYRNSDGGGQVVEWEGRTRDANTTRLAVEDPTAARTITLPDADGYVALATSGSTKVTCGEVTVDPPLLPSRATQTLSAGAPVVAHSACTCSVRGDWHDEVLLKGCSTSTDGALELRLFNMDNSSVADAATPALAVDYCCTAK